LLDLQRDRLCSGTDESGEAIPQHGVESRCGLSEESGWSRTSEIGESRHSAESQQQQSGLHWHLLVSERGEELFMAGETLHALSMDSRVVTEHDAERFHAVGMSEGARTRRSGRRREREREREKRSSRRIERQRDLPHSLTPE